jgi:MFS family permease
MEESLHLTSTQYATAVSILFVGYVSMQIPSNVFLAQLRPSIYLPCVMAIWGLLSALTGVTQNATGLYALRFFLGIFEAAFYRKSIHFFGQALYSVSR